MLKFSPILASCYNEFTIKNKGNLKALKVTTRQPLIITAVFYLILVFSNLAIASDFKGIDADIKEILVDKKRIYRKAIVKTQENKQSLDYQIYGIHPNKCKVALRKLSRYEKFNEYIDLVKLSGYSEKKKEIYLYLDHTLMPFPMSLNFKIPRITKPGAYPFTFDKGFLKGLRGEINVRQLSDGRCLFFSKSYWKGEKSSIPDTLFEMFSETLGELAMEKLFRVSRRL
ncbi:hypothetical protein C0Z22_02735 [Halobacteriovorax sp. DA5]|nr:hypothetical protein C0Z22_02735 [Halobacteriovorax sp. DA5]